MITNGQIITMNAEKKVYSKGTIVIKDKKIIAIGDDILKDQ